MEILAAAQESGHKLLLVLCAVLGLVGLGTFFWGWSKPKSELSGVLIFVGVAFMLVGVFMAANLAGAT